MLLTAAQEYAAAPGRITGLDFFPGFIDRFNADARRLHLADRVKGVVGSMDALPFRAGELDLIWSEGAIYNIGFERGLNEWREYLKPGGYLAVSESVWFTDERPTEIHDFWVDAYPEIDTIPNKVAQIHRAGYLPVAAFVLPETCWMEHYFAPLAKARELFAAKYPGDSTAEGLMAFQRYEEELYRKYNEFYGYVFFIARKPNPRRTLCPGPMSNPGSTSCPGPAAVTCASSRR